MIFFTADTHFDSPEIIKLDPLYSKFKSAEEINELTISNWNAIVSPSDTVWHLGDFGKATDGRAQNLLAIVQKLNGNICLVAGNHDPNNIWPVRKKLGCYTEYKELNVDIPGSERKQKIVLFHYAMRTWRYSFKGSWHLFGHSHGNMPPYCKSFDVGIMKHNFKPVSLDQVRELMASLPAPTLRDSPEIDQEE